MATIGLIQERALHQQGILVGQLQTALDSRVIIEQAKGVIAERRGIDPSEAFTLLRTHARNHNQRLAELAAGVLDGTAGELVSAIPSPSRQRAEPAPPSRYAGRRRKATRG